MGAQEFVELAEGATAREALAAAVSRAKYQYGHGGYTGTIAEKRSSDLRMVSVPGNATPSAAEALAHARKLVEEMGGDEKWGPASCIGPLAPSVAGGPPRWVFFGLASS